MIQWTPALETGHEIVDQDHQQLIRTINSLETALKGGVAKDELNRIITFLVVYTQAHFAREEDHMKRVRCPSLAQNCAAHAELKKKLESWAQRLKLSGPTTSLVLEIYRESSAWITDHILRVDCKLRECHHA